MAIEKYTRNFEDNIAIRKLYYMNQMRKIPKMYHNIKTCLPLNASWRTKFAFNLSFVCFKTIRVRYAILPRPTDLANMRI